MRNPITHLSANLVETFGSLFVGRPDAWGTITGGCVKETVTLDHYHRHLTSKVSLGIYPLLDDGTCYWVAADLDQVGDAQWHNGPDDSMPALRLMASLSYYGINRGLSLEKTKCKGWRPWLFFSEPVSARDARRLFRAALARAGLPSSVEIFPKQDNAEGIDVGNYVHLPYFGGGPSGERGGRVMVHPETLVAIPLVDFLRHLQPFPVDALPSVLNKLPEEKVSGGIGHSADRILEMLTRPLAVGERRPTLVALAGYLRYRSIPEEVAVALLLPWAERAFAEPLPVEEVERHVRGIYGRYGVRERRVAKPDKSWHAEVPL
jgi:hypothetical protein